MIRVRVKGNFGEVEVESEPKQMRDINNLPTIVGDTPLYDAIKLYKELGKVHENNS